MYPMKEAEGICLQATAVRKLFLLPIQVSQSIAESLCPPRPYRPNTVSWLLLMLALFICHPAALAQKDIVSGSADGGTANEAATDPLAPAMVAVEIQKRLDASSQQIDATNEETIRNRWVHIRQLLQMQLERLDALEGEFSQDTIEYPANAPPFPLSYLDQTRHKHQKFKAAHAQLEKARKAAEKRIQATQETYVAAKQKLTTIEEEGGTSEEQEGAELDFELARESVIYARLDARLINRKLKQANINLQQIGETIPEIEKEVVFSEQDYKIQLENIQKRQQLLGDALEKIRWELTQELNKPKDKRVHHKALESLQALLSEAQSYLHYEKTIWDERRQIYLGDADAQETVKWHKENSLKRKEISELLQVNRLGQLKHMKVLVDKEQQQSVVTIPVNVELQKEMLVHRQLAFDSLESVVELLTDHLADLNRIRSVQRLSFLKEKIIYVANSIWRLQLAVVQDRAITVGKSVTAIMLFIGGLIIVRLVILRLLYFLLRKIRVREGVAYTITQLLFYLTLLVLLFGAISYAGIPLHIFAFFGGALAIAAGFGSQKIISNFLSGVVLLLEGSIRVGDMVQVDDSTGRIRSIGLRHTQMTTFNNVDILIPNAKFLEENVINWTLESEVIRSNIELGVDFTAPVDVVIATLVQAAVDHPDILDEPKPEAYLETINNDHGYLGLKLYYWHEMHNPREGLAFSSALQIEIITRLRAQGIELTSPTQNVITHSGSAVS